LNTLTGYSFLYSYSSSSGANYRHSIIDGSLYDGADVIFSAIEVFTISQADAVPEPATLALLGVGLAGLGYSRRKQ
jgi:hypothetical protein